MDLSQALKMIRLVNETFVRELGLKLFDNYNFRTVPMFLEVKNEIWDDLVLSTKRTGVDASTVRHGFPDVELKTSGSKYPTFMWDKQTEESRRKATLESNAFVFGHFPDEEMAVILVAKDPATVEGVRELLRKKQNAFLPKWEAKVSAGGRGGSDAITISMSQLYKLDVRWSMWVRGTWHHGITGAEAAKLVKN